MFSDNLLWHLWGASLVLLVGLSGPLQRSKTLRGGTSEFLTWKDYFFRTLLLYTLFFGAPIALYPRIFIPLFLIYLPTYLDGSERDGSRYDAKFGRYLKSMTLWSKWAKYWDMHLIADDPTLDRTRQYVIGAHPHVLLPIGTGIVLSTAVCDVDSKLPRVRLALGASIVFLVPLMRDFFLYTGAVDAARPIAVRMLNKGACLVIAPGGATEALLCHPHVHAIYLTRRKGFVRLAMQTGVPLLPVYTFGEMDAFHTVPLSIAETVGLAGKGGWDDRALSPPAAKTPAARKLRGNTAPQPTAVAVRRKTGWQLATPLKQRAKILPPALQRRPTNALEHAAVALRLWVQKTFGFTVPVVWPVPRRVKKLVAVIGRPVEVPHLATPTDDEVDAALQLYADELVRIFDKYAPLYEEREDCRKLHIY